MLSCQVLTGEVKVILEGNLCSYDNEAEKAQIYATIAEQKKSKISFDAKKLTDWDSTTVGFLYKLSKGRKEIDVTSLPKDLAHLLQLALKVDRKPPEAKDEKQDFFEKVGENSINGYKSFCQGVSFIKDSMKSMLRLLSGRAIMRKVDFLFALEGCSYQAVGIISLISFMVGLILAFVGAIQMQTFGVEIYVSSLVAIAMTRIMGAIMAGIVMSGRTGASYAATIGTMQVNEEVDALRTMGIPITDFLVLPRISALMITMPFLTMLSDLMGMIGGAVVGTVMLGFSIDEYWQYTEKALKMSNFLLGILHGFVYGYIIALCGCYYGVHCGRNANSVGVATTKAVVASIVWMIVITGILTVIIEEAGA